MSISCWLNKSVFVILFTFCVLLCYSQTLVAGKSTPTFQMYNTNNGTSSLNLYADNATGGSCSDASCYLYQWQYFNGGTWQDIANANSTSYNAGSLGISGRTYFRLKVTNGSQTAYCNADTVDVQTSSVDGADNAWNGQTTTYYFFNSYSSPGDVANYDWTVSGGTFSGSSHGVTTVTVKWTSIGKKSITVSSKNINYFLYVYVSNLALDPGRIGTSILHVQQNSSINSIGCSEAIGGGCNGSFAYQWQQSTDGSTFTNVTNATSKDFSSVGLIASQRLYFRRRVICGTTTLYSDTIIYQPYPVLDAGTIALGTTDSSAWNTSPLPITGSQPSGGFSDAYTYQWYYSTDGSAYYPVLNGGQGINYQPPILTTSTSYYRNVTSDGVTKQSNTVKALVKIVQFDPGTISPYTSVINSGSSKTLNGTASTGGTVATYTYQWQQSNDEINWINCSGGGSASFTTPNLTKTTYYRRFVTNGAQNGFAFAASSFNRVKVKVVNSLGASAVPNATIKSSGDASISETPVNSYLLSAINSAKTNYVRSWDMEKPGVTAIAGVKALSSVYDVKQGTSFLDDYGRTIQSVEKQITPLQKDLVTVQNYDLLGRTTQQFLPYTDNTTTGDIKTDAQIKQNSYYDNLYANNEGYYYSNTQYEKSPLNRVLKQTASGNSWTGNNIGIRTDYNLNTSLDSVIIWTIGTGLTDYPVSNSYYKPGALLLTVTTDEHENKTIEYKDKEGKVILKKVQISDDLRNGHSGWLCTYYVYDVFNRLRYVIQPKAVDYAINNSLSLNNTTVLNELCFKYNYDEEGKIVTKKVPGADEVWMVYDNRDRLVYTQDGNMRGKNWWMTTLYDNLNRALQTGVLSYSSTRENLQSYVITNGLAASSVSAAGSGVSSLPVQLTIQQRETGRQNYKATSSIELLDGFVTEDGAAFTAEIAAGTTPVYNGNQNAYTSAFPSGATYTPLTITFYDGYSFTQKTYTTSNNANLNDVGTNLYGEALPSQNNPMTKGMVTGTRIRVIENPNDLTQGKWMETVSYFDEKNRLIQSQSDNYKGGADVLTNRYSFSGRVLANYLVHNNSAAGINNLAVKTIYNYDGGGRVSSIQKSINNGSVKTILQNDYNEIGQLKNKKLGTSPSNANNPMETLSYEYNIRGWLRGINKDYARNENSASAWFGMELNYDFGFTNTQLNGNIAGNRWRSKGDGEQRSCGYNYDAANRLVSGEFNQFTSGTFNKTAGLDFSVNNLNYDLNGNIIGMKQMGVQLSSSLPIDQLKYIYQTNSNKLQQVTDTANNNLSLLGDFKYDPSTKTATDYTYDNNGNLQQDNNKSISSIAYNYLNLPSVITVTGKGTVSYIYDASGNKLEKRVTDNTLSPAKQTTTTYLGNFIYQDNILQFFNHEEGRIRKKGSSDFVYDYFIKDHLNNVRMVLTEEQKQDVYPAATLEVSGITTEKAYFDIQDGNIVANPPALATATNFPYNNNNGNPPYNTNPNVITSAQSTRLYKLNGANNVKTGLGITLKVMAGDTVSIWGKSYYHLNSGQTATNSYAVSSALLSLLTSFAGGTAVVGKGVTGATLNANSPTTTPLTTMVNNNPTPSGNIPKAGVNWILFDEQFKPVANGYDAVYSNGDYVKTHMMTTNISRNGYLYIYCSDESNVDVYFDNLQVMHNRGPLVEETHYYPFGLTMAGISSKAAGGMENKFKANGSCELQNQEFSDGSGLDLYDATFRMYDAQIGRFMQIDPLAELSRSWSPFSFVQDNPISFSDPLGLTDSTDVPGFENSTTGAKTLPGVTVVSKKPANSSSTPTTAFIGGGPGSTLLPNSPSTPAAPTTAPPTVEPGGIVPLSGWLLRGLGTFVATIWPSDAVKTNGYMRSPLPDGASPYVHFDNDKDLDPLRIGLGVDEYLPHFADAEAAVPYWNWGEDMPDIPSAAAYSAAIARLGQMRNVSFHFLLSTPRGRLDAPVNLAANANKITTAEFKTIMSSPFLRSKTTFYQKSGSIYKPTQPMSSQ